MLSSLDVNNSDGVALIRSFFVLSKDTSNFQFLAFLNETFCNSSVNSLLDSTVLVFVVVKDLAENTTSRLKVVHNVLVLGAGKDWHWGSVLSDKASDQTSICDTNH